MLFDTSFITPSILNGFFGTTRDIALIFIVGVIAIFSMKKLLGYVKDWVTL